MDVKEDKLEQIKALRVRSGDGMTDCKKALIQADWDMEKAYYLLQDKGLGVYTNKRGGCYYGC